MQNIYTILCIITFHVILLGYAFYIAKATTLANRIKIGMGIGPGIIFIYFFLLVGLQKVNIILEVSSIMGHAIFLILYIPVFSLYFAIKKRGNNRTRTQ